MGRLTALFYGIVGTVLAGIAIVVIVAVPSLAERAAIFIPISALASLVLALPIAWLVARAVAGTQRSPA